MPQCTSSLVANFYCPTTNPQNLVALMSSGDNPNVFNVLQQFSIINAETFLENLPNPLNPPAAIPGTGLYTPSSGQFIWGLPFFYGRNIYVATSNSITPFGIGPYFAY